MLDAVGALEYLAEAPAIEEEVSASAAGQELEIEIVLSAEAASEPAAEAESPAAGATGEESATTDRGDSELVDLREEVLEKHRRLRDLSLYELLGVERDAAPAAIKRAYIRAA